MVHRRRHRQVGRAALIEVSNHAAGVGVSNSGPAVALVAGISVVAVALWISSTIAGGAFGMCLFAQLADRIGRKPLFIAFQARISRLPAVFKGRALGPARQGNGDVTRWVERPLFLPTKRRHIAAFRARPDSVCVRLGLAAWGGRIRTSASQNQNSRRLLCILESKFTMTLSLGGRTRTCASRIAGHSLIKSLTSDRRPRSH